MTNDGRKAIAIEMNSGRKLSASLVSINGIMFVFRFEVLPKEGERKSVTERERERGQRRLPRAFRCLESGV